MPWVARSVLCLSTMYVLATRLHNIMVSRLGTMCRVNGQEKKEAYAAGGAGHSRVVVGGGDRGDMSPVTGPANKDRPCSVGWVLGRPYNSLSERTDACLADFLGWEVRLL